jgi:uncharacterized membrane protein HdeD (DUF308 family)
MEYIKQNLAMVAVIGMTFVGFLVKQSDPLLGAVLLLAGSMMAVGHYISKQDDRWPWLAFWIVFLVIDLYRLMNLV